MFEFEDNSTVFAYLVAVLGSLETHKQVKK